MSERHFVCGLAELPDGKTFPVTVDDYEIVLIRHGEEVHALEDNCSHQDFPLSQGEVLPDRIQCRAHGAEFCLRTGKALKPPAFAAVKPYVVGVDGGQVWIETD